MKKYLAAVMFGMASGVAGSYIMYTEYKNGNLSKMINKANNKVQNVMNKISHN